MKRLLLVLTACLGLTSAAVAQSVSARVGGELTGFENQRITVPIVVDMTAAGGAKLGSYTARLEWDPGVLGFDYRVAAGDFPAPHINADSTSQGILKFGGISAAGQSGVITLAGLGFYIQQPDAGTSLTLQFPEMSAAGTFANLLPVTITNGVFCSARGRWGDLDTDGSSNSRDALAILSKVVGQDVDTELFDVTLGDVDSDTKINSRDALIILSYAVGLDIPGQRVLLPAASSCGTGSAKQISVFPAAASLVPNQELQLFARGIDAQGHAVTLEGANWRSSDNTIAGIDANGNVLPRAQGTATMTASVGPGLKAQAIVTVIARRPNWFVDMRATGAPVQLGTAAFPFEHPTQAFDLLSEGDTVRVASGTYPFDYDGQLDVGAVILGGTPGDTTTRPVFRDVYNSSNLALWLRGGFRTVVKNVVFENFDRAVDLEGVRNFVMEDVRVSATLASYGIYSCGGVMDTVRIDRSEFAATDSSGSAIFFNNCDRTGLTVIRDSKFTAWDNGVFLHQVDSVAVIRSVISRNRGSGLYVGEDPNQTEPALYLSQSRVELNGNVQVEINRARRVVIENSVVRAQDGNGLELSGPCCGPTAQIYLRGDSIYFEADDYDWLDVSNADTLLLDHVVVRFPADTAIYAYSDISADKGFVTYTHFANVADGVQAFDFNGSEFHADSVEMTGCNVINNCDGGDGFSLSSSGSVLNAQVQRSRFTSIGYPVYTESNNGIHMAKNLVIDSAQYAIDVSGDTSYVTGNVLTRVWGTGIGAGNLLPNNGRSFIVGNNVGCVPGPIESIVTGVELYSRRKNVVRADTVSNCNIGVQVSQVNTGTMVVGGALRNNSTAIKVQTDTSAVLIDSVGISGSSYSAVEVVGGSVTVIRSRIESNPNYGLYVGGPGFVTQAHQNSFVGNGTALYASDTVDARSNWWGVDAPPCTAGPNCINGIRVAATGYLSAEPTILPGLAPRVLASSPARINVSPVSVGQPNGVARHPYHQAKVAAVRKTPPARSTATPTRASNLAREQEQTVRREAAEARRAANRAAHLPRVESH